MKFQLFRQLDSIESVLAGRHAADFYTVLAQLRDAVQGSGLDWSNYPIMREYAEICFWAIRKLEYSFAAESFACIEAQAKGRLRVLDVGCGVVPLCNWMSRRGHDVTAIDPSESDIELLNRDDLNAFYASRVTYDIGRAEHLAFPSETFDVVTCISVLEHIPPGNDRIALMEMARVLKPGGRLILTFDVSPPPRPQPGESRLPAELRRYALPFSVQSIQRLLKYLRLGYDGLEDPLPPEFVHLTWDDVHAFWRTGQIHDGRSEPEREYLAMGGVLSRAAQVEAMSESEVASAYVEGQAALEERLRFFHLHAEERLALINRLDEEGQALQSQLVEKEQVIRELDSEAGERLEMLEQLQDRPVLRTVVDSSATRLEAIENLLIQQGAKLSELSAHVEGLSLALQSQTDLLGVAASMSGAGADERDSAVLAAILAWRQDLDQVLTKQSERLASAAVSQAEASVREELRVLRYEKEAAESAAEARLLVIEEQKRTLASQRRWRFAHRLRSSFEPRIGVLYHYEPRHLFIPSWYSRPKTLTAAPVVSIVTPTLNQGRFLERTVKSVLGQAYPALEYIVQDGASTDETLEVLQKYASDLASVASERDDGFACAINRGFQRATGDILAYLNSDDVLLPGALNYVVDYFTKHPNVDVVYGHRVLIDEYDREVGRWVLPSHDDEILSWADYIPQETLFWRRRIWEGVGGAVDESFKFAVDWDLLIRFREAGAKMHRLPRFLAAFRVHPDQKTTSEMQVVGHREMERVRERALGRHATTAEIGTALAPYLRSSVLYHKLYRLGVLRY